MADSKQDSTYNNALEEKQRLELQRTEIDARLAEVESFLRLYPQFAPHSEPEQAPENGNTESGDPEHPDQPEKGISQKKFEAIAVEILSTIGQPMSRKRLREAFRSRHVFIGGVNPEKNFGTKLWKAASGPKGRLSYDEDAGYRIRSEDES